MFWIFLWLGAIVIIFVPIIYLIKWLLKGIEQWHKQREIQMQKYSDFEKEHLNNQALLLFVSFFIVLQLAALIK